MNYRIGVMGSAVDADDSIKRKARTIGRKIAELDCTLVTGGCGGLPYEAVLGAKEMGGYTIGVSPANNRYEHAEKFNMPYKEYDELIYTGFGLKGRTVPLVRSCDGLIVVAGRVGSLVESGIGYDEGKIIGLLDGVGGVSHYFNDWVNLLGKPTKGSIVKYEDPELLVEEVYKLVALTK